MSDKTKRILGWSGFILAALATAVMTSSLGSKPAVHTACEVALKFLALAGFTTSASAFGATQQQQPLGLELPKDKS